MLVRIFTEAGTRIGYGHLTRCIALYDEMVDRKIKVKIIIKSDIDVSKILENRKHEIINWLDFECLKNKLNLNDFAIVDSYIATYEHYDLIRSESKQVLFIDDYGRIKYPNGIIVNPALDIGNIDYSYFSKIQVHFGPKFIIIRSPFTNMRKASLRKDVQKVLITMGGTDFKNITSLIIDSICTKYKNIKFEIVVNSTLLDKTKNTEQFNNVRFHSNLSADEMANLMYNVDLAISAAGQTIYELITVQTPFLVIKTAENQSNNINSLLKYIPKQKALFCEENNFLDLLKKNFNHCISFNYRSNVFENMKNTIDGNGISRIIDLLLKTTKYTDIYIRNANMKDMLPVFELSNKDYVREYSKNKGRIDLISHQKWFSDVLSDPLSAFYIVTNSTDDFLGQIRFKMEDTESIISISISDKLRGKGKAKTILDQSLANYFSTHMSVNEVIAYISSKNIPSLKLFASLGFKYVSQKDDIEKFIIKRGDYFEN
ncbi:UDP-2,4-diacetamido-2,4,6-trideoxy-beta-L-altropyranose hydrolase [Mycoplasmatota bacterium]|nr:UDP-2,4-diacetamido-2,4,6-trideoxy-beta-L-altropyranose hydrolase [Mycoplasmatota bacterium]